MELRPLAERDVSRLPPLPDPLPPEVEALFAERTRLMGRLINLHYLIGHAPNVSRASAQMALALRNNTSADRLYIEYSIVQAARAAHGAYELQQHLPMLRAAGAPQAKIDALPNWRASPLFDDKERALLAYVDEMCDRGNVSDATFAAMQAAFTSQQIVEVSFAVATYYGMALLMNALKLKLEKPQES